MNAWAWLCGLNGVMNGVSEEELSADPIKQFSEWFVFARRARIYQHNAFSLSTCTPDGKPSSRMLLLKGVDPLGLIFYTNYDSRKGGELASNPRASMLFFWSELHRQIRVEGVVDRLDPQSSARYFHSRPRGSQIGAWASLQSRELHRRDELAKRVKEAERMYAGQEVPLPPFWGGFRLRPERFEFWQGRAFRLHDRVCYDRAESAWRKFRLYP